jgi:hypothetical protein
MRFMKAEAFLEIDCHRICSARVGMKKIGGK